MMPDIPFSEDYQNLKALDECCKDKIYENVLNRDIVYQRHHTFYWYYDFGHFFPMKKYKNERKNFILHVFVLVVNWPPTWLKTHNIYPAIVLTQTDNCLNV